MSDMGRHGRTVGAHNMAKFIAKKISVDNSDLNELDGFVPIKGVDFLSLTIGGSSFTRSSVYEGGELTVKWSVNGELKYTLKTDVSAKGLKKIFQGDNWEPKFFEGADTIKGSTQADMLYGFKGNDNIHGKAGGDTMFGGAGKDFLDGGAGVNTLTGGGAKDTFAFSAALMGGNYSEITDFQEGKDKFQLSKSAFDGIGGKGTLNKGKFFLESEYTGKAKSVIYDEATGTLKYSKAGGDIANAQSFGRVEIGTDLSHKDFLIA
jgi:Ca2+-binding RTX toxin-like protein